MDLLAWGNGLIIRLGLYLLIFWPTVGYYVYTDLQKRDANRSVLKSLGYGFFGILGLFVYLAKRDRARTAD